MEFTLDRPFITSKLGSGLLRVEHFQMAYLTNDMAKAKALLGDGLGISAFADIAGEMPGGGSIKAAFGWVGTILYELIEVTDTQAMIYKGFLPQEDLFHLRHHHLGFLVNDQAEMDLISVQAHLKAFKVVYFNRNALVDATFVEVPGLGHYLEYLLPSEAGLAFFNSVPRT